jgi:hypothetical protein
MVEMFTYISIYITDVWPTGWFPLEVVASADLNRFRMSSVAVSWRNCCGYVIVQSLL